MIWGLLILLLAFTLAFALMPVLQRSGGKMASAGRHDLAVYQAQLLELATDREQGQISENEFKAANLEIQRRILKLGVSKDSEAVVETNRLFPLTVILLALVIAGVFYLRVGEPTLPGMTALEKPAPVQIPGEPGMDELLVELRARLEVTPEDQNGWRLMAQSMAVLGRHGDAARAYGRLIRLDPENPDWRVQMAEALVRMNEGTVSPAALLAFEQATALAPDHPAPPFYRGLAFFQSGNIEAAYDIWTRLATSSTPDAPWMGPLKAQIAAAEQRLGITPVAPAISVDDMKAVAALSTEEQQAFIESMVDRLAARLEASPDDLDGWQRLAQAQMTLGRQDRAIEALRHAEALATGTLAEKIRNDISALQSRR